ncbi:hypothetical protein PGT21_011982 [Puccinia graminis f. sp. tritici]|uniref:RanBP2-type domain-containing protein n=1 Tax=Puccinia graminis f. sp. tritici TaxID=56615 RepID=A0A5B0NA63_PUCGR|nr:hypothetical protein PGT21_011982 [Puccinia graminis f. sp. tritici]KAA1135993.1 hypothetical protein PGTUg99_018259 [Puccinia graminis f. sp. tritici]
MQLHTGRSALICLVVLLVVMPARSPRPPARRGSTNRICANCVTEGYEGSNSQRWLFKLPSPTERPCAEVLAPIPGEGPCSGIITGDEWSCYRCNCRYFESAQGCLTCESGKAKRYFPQSRAPPE